MKKRNIIKTVSLVIISFIILFILFSNYQVLATLGDPAENPGNWKPDDINEPEIMEKAGKILGVISTIGIVSSVIALTGLGIKYFLGSVEEKASFKKSLLPYVIGVVLLGACSTIPNLLYIISKAITE